MNKLYYLWAIPGVFLASIIVSALGSHTVNYQCKYVQDVQVKVAAHEKYATALYTIKYNDGTMGTTSDVDNNGPAGLDRGYACRTVFNWGFPYSSTNRHITDESTIQGGKQ